MAYDQRQEPRWVDQGNAMVTKCATHADDLDSRWRLRENRWRRKLGRLRLGVEPLEEQLARYRGVTWALTVVPSVLALMFLTLFAVFGRPDIGLIFDAIILLPIIIVAWLDYALLASRARRYLAELGEYLLEKELMMTENGKNDATSEHA
jgi:hypothetical protein